MSLSRYSDNKLSLFLFLASAIWGLFWVPLRELEQAGLIGTWGVVLFNVAGLSLLVPLILWKRKTQLRNWGAVLPIAIFTGLGMGMYTVALLMTDVVRATMLFYLTSIWSSLIGWYWLSEQLSRARIVATGLGLLGLFLLVSGGGDVARPLGIGDLLALLSGIAWAIGASCIKRWPDAPVLLQTAGMLTVTTLFALLFGLIVFGLQFPTSQAVWQSLPILVGASWFLLVPSAVLIMAISKRLFPGRVGILMMSEVFVAIFSATLLLPQEVMSLLQWTGGVAIIAACFCEVFDGSFISKQRSSF